MISVLVMASLVAPNPFMEDMTLPHEGIPAGIDADWAKKPRVGMRQLPEGWNSATMWGQIYPEKGAGLPKNVRVQIREPRLWALSRKTGKWTLVQSSKSVEGACYRLDFSEDANIPADFRKEPGGSTSILMAPKHNFHFWPTQGRVVMERSDVAAMASAFSARLVLDDPKGVDERSRARLFGSCGGDFWRTVDAQWKADWSSNGDWAISRFKRLTKEWKSFYATNAEAEVFEKSPPPQYR